MLRDFLRERGSLSRCCVGLSLPTLNWNQELDNEPTVPLMFSVITFCHFYHCVPWCRYPWVCLVRGCVPFPRLGKFSLPFSSLFLLRSLLWKCYYAWWCDRVPLLFLLFTIVDFHYPASRTCSSATSNLLLIPSSVFFIQSL